MKFSSKYASIEFLICENEYVTQATSVTVESQLSYVYSMKILTNIPRSIDKNNLDDWVRLFSKFILHKVDQVHLLYVYAIFFVTLLLYHLKQVAVPSPRRRTSFNGHGVPKVI